MSNLVEMSSLHGELAAVQASAVDLHQRWPREIALELERRSDCYALPYLLLAAFPSLQPRDLRPLATFCKLHAGAIFLHHGVHHGLDGGGKPSNLAASLLRIRRMHAEAYHLLHPRFPAQAPFWDRLRGYLSAYANACAEDHRFASGDRPWREYTEAVALRIVVGKNGVARIIAAGMAELAGDERLLDPLLEITSAFNTAKQMWDDLQNWRDDLRRGTPSLLLARLVPERPEGLDAEAWRSMIQRVARKLYYGGHARHVLDLALASLDTAEQLKTTIPGLGLHAVTADLRRSCEELRADIERVLRMP